MVCPLCLSPSTSRLFGPKMMPVYNLQRHLSLEAALNAPVGTVTADWCRDCDFLFNGSFDPSLMSYAVDYDASRSISPYFRAYLESVADDVAKVLEISGKLVVEVGCGDGAFTNLLSNRGARAHGFDPSDAIPTTEGDATFHRAYYDRDKLNADVIVLRHILEHQADPRSFLNMLLSESAQGVYIEVPAWEWIVKENLAYAFSYEHCSHFSAYSLTKFLDEFGFAPIQCSYSFNGEYLQLFGSRLKGPVGFSYKRMTDQDVMAFAENLTSSHAILKELLKGDAVLWGASGKGTTLLNMVGITRDTLPFVVDSNPNRWGNFIPCTGQEIIPPEYLKTLKPKKVALTNSLYKKEILNKLTEMGLKPEFILIDDLLKASPLLRA